MPADAWAVALAYADEGGSSRDIARALQALAKSSGMAVHFIAAGRLVRRAWETLSDDTADLLARAKEERPIVPPPHDEDPMLAFLEDPFIRDLDDEGLIEETLVAWAPHGLRPSVRRPAAPRAVTLIELVEALREAYAYADVVAAQQRDVDERRRLTRLARGKPAASIVDEDPQEDISALLRRLPLIGPARLDQLSKGSRLERAGLFMAALELAKAGKVRVVQPDFPFGPVWVERAASS